MLIFIPVLFVLCSVVHTNPLIMAESKFTDEERDSLVKVFEEMDVKPDVANSDAMTQWMKSYLQQTGKIDVAKKPDGTLGGTQLVHTPKVVVFSGDESKDAVYDLWRYEVMSMVKEKTYSLPVIMNAARKSLRGEAARVVMRLGENVTLDDLIYKLDCIYGNVESVEMLLAKFYSASQEDGESVSSWACRLEDMYSKISKRSNVKPSNEAIKPQNPPKTPKPQNPV